MPCESAAICLAPEAMGDSPATAACARKRITGKRSLPGSTQQATQLENSSALGKRRRPGANVAEKDSPILALVVNLQRRQDRWEAMRQRLAPFEKQGLLRVRRLAATDGLKDEVPDLEVGRVWTTERNAKYDGRPGYRAGVSLEMTAGERGCAHSHVCAWREVAAGTAPVLVFEDDAVVLKGFAEKLRPRAVRAAAADADVLYFGYIQGAPWRSKVSPGLREAEYLWTTVCYMLWPEGARKLLATLPIDEPIDNFMAWQMSTKRVRALAITPALVDQELEWDQGSDVPHSDDAVFPSED